MRLRAAGLAAALTLSLAAGCSGTDDGPAATATPGERLAEFDAFVLASEENDPAVADVYGLRLDPFTVERITVDKSVSALGADAERVVVAAADAAVDRLALLDGSGTLLDVPGLGRPEAYSPILRDGVLYFDDAAGAKAKGRYRFFSFDLAKQAKTLVLQSTRELGAPKPMADGSLLLTTTQKDGQERLVVRDGAGKTSTLPPLGDVAVVRPGVDLVGVTLVRDEGKSRALLLFNPATGDKQVIPDLQILAWSPDGKRILARRTTDVPNDSRLVVLDPAKAPYELGTLPNLSIFSGVWVRGNVPA
ncbi:MAG: hypothetical protein ACT4QF_14350 [Sporichthyaceae bacterium]